jgi:5-(carboxyamino)imidazole ribonucleotide synthase
MYKQPRIGILGGGQLGRMLIQAGIDLNIYFKVLDPDPSAPCKNIADEFVCGSLLDENTLFKFAEDIDILTIEIEAVNTDALQIIADKGTIKVFPQPSIVKMIQDKRLQKQFYITHNIPTASFILTETIADVWENKHYLPAVHKCGKGGYDGKGVQVIKNTDDIAKGFDVPSVLEKLVEIEKEISVIVVKSANGQIQTFPVVECVYHPEHNLVDYLLSPADITTAHEEKAKQIAIDLVKKLDYIGILAVEMFIDKQGTILVNEIAPRPHNSGHQTIEGNFSSQYQEMLRAIIGLPLGNTETRTYSAMINLLGEAGYEGEAHYQGIEKVLALPNVYIHLYGKTITKPFRKMGHITLLGNDKREILQKMDIIKKNLKIISQ